MEKDKNTADKYRFSNAMGTFCCAYAEAAAVLNWMESKGGITAQLVVTANDINNSFIFITRGFEKFCRLCDIDAGQIATKDMNEGYTKKEVTAFGMRVFCLEEK